jgi:hypothetical protein
VACLARRQLSSDRRECRARRLRATTFFCPHTNIPCRTDSAVSHPRLLASPLLQDGGRPATGDPPADASVLTHFITTPLGAGSSSISMPLRDGTKRVTLNQGVRHPGRELCRSNLVAEQQTTRTALSAPYSTSATISSADEISHYSAGMSAHALPTSPHLNTAQLPLWRLHIPPRQPELGWMWPAYTEYSKHTAGGSIRATYHSSGTCSGVPKHLNPKVQPYGRAAAACRADAASSQLPFNVDMPTANLLSHTEVQVQVYTLSSGDKVNANHPRRGWNNTKSEGPSSSSPPPPTRLVTLITAVATVFTFTSLKMAKLNV